MSTALCKTSVLRLYNDVIEDVISGVRELFIEDGVDEQVLQELKQTWEQKLMASKAVHNEQEEKIKKQSEMVATNGFPKQQVMTMNQVVPQGTPIQSVAQVVETKMVPIQITLPPQPGSDPPTQRVLTIQVPATALQGNQLQKVLTGPVITATMNLPVNIASSLLQQHVNAAFNSQQHTVAIVNKPVIQADGCNDAEEDFDQAGPSSSAQPSCSYSTRKGVGKKKNKKNKNACLKEIIVGQTDGPLDTSDEDEDGSEDDGDDEDIDDDKDEEDQEMEEEGGEEEPLNSEDDVTDDDPSDLFDTDNIVVCQYDKIIRNRNKWKFYLKDGIMNLNGIDYVFQKANGDAEW